MLQQRQKINLKKMMKFISLEYLRLPPTIYQIQIQKQEYFITTDTNELRRRIFYLVPYLQKQKKAIQEIKNLFEKQLIFDKFQDALILKHLYAAKFDLKTTLERLQKVQAYHNNETIIELNQNTIEELKRGVVYSYGHDLNWFPIIIVRADRFNYSLSVDQNYNIVYYILLIVLGYRMVPYYIQKYITIMDLNDMDITKLPYSYLYEIFSKMNLFYCGNVEKTYVYNSKGIGLLWKIFSKFIPSYQQKRVVFIEKGQQTKTISKFISPYQLEQRYGGKLKNLKQYWPPPIINQEFDNEEDYQQGKEEQINQQNCTSFYSLQNDMSYFQIELKNSTFCGQDYNCSII